MVFGPFHYYAFCERAAPDAPETIDDQRRCTGCRLSDNLRRLARERIPTGGGRPGQEHSNPKTQNPKLKSSRADRVRPGIAPQYLHKRAVFL